jgi:hypothetical protein
MSNIEFIPANELPTTEANEVDVLCVENGELKLKAGASLGGGDAEYDLILRVVGGYDEEAGNQTVIEYEVIQGSYDAVKQKIDNAIEPKVLISGEFRDGDYIEKVVYETRAFWYSITSEGYEALDFDDYFDLLPDNTVVPKH